MSGAVLPLPEEEIWTGLSAVQRDTLIGEKLVEAEAMGWIVHFAEREEPDGSWSLWVAYEGAPPAGSPGPGPAPPTPGSGPAPVPPTSGPGPAPVPPPPGPHPAPTPEPPRSGPGPAPAPPTPDPAPKPTPPTPGPSPTPAPPTPGPSPTPTPPTPGPSPTPAPPTPGPSPTPTPPTPGPSPTPTPPTPGPSPTPAPPTKSPTPSPQPAPRPPPVPDGAAAIAHHLRLGATTFAVDLDCLGAIAAVESAFRPLAKNPNSSAFGLFQFITGTWNDVVRKHGPAHGVAAADRAVLRAQCLMGAAHLSDNAAALRTALGRKATHGECYAAHFFGIGDARRLFRMPRDTPADVALGPRAPAVIGANRSIFIRDGRMRTVGEVLQLFDAKMARGLTAARALPI